MAAGLALALCAGAATARAQAPARIDLSGTWQRDTHLSDRPEQVEASIRADLGLGGESPYPEGPESGRSGRGPEREGYPGRGRAGREAPPQAPSADEQRQLDDMIRAVRNPSARLTIDQDSTKVTFTDEKGQSTSFRTDVKREKQTFGSVTIETTARWEGPQLVIEFDLTKGRSMTWTYMILPETQVLFLRITFSAGRSRSARSISSGSTTARHRRNRPPRHPISRSTPAPPVPRRSRQLRWTSSP